MQAEGTPRRQYGGPIPCRNCGVEITAKPWVRSSYSGVTMYHVYKCAECSTITRRVIYRAKP